MITIILLPLMIIGLHEVIWSFLYFFDIDDKVRMFFEDSPTVLKFIMKPLFFCNMCMTSFWGTVFYWLVMDLDGVAMWVIHLLSSVTIIAIFNILDKRP